MQAFNRDVEAAIKIAARLFAELRGLDLGPWARDTILDDIPSSALVESQICYRTLVFGGSPNSL
jgi:hypothetical protein